MNAFEKHPSVEELTQLAEVGSKAKVTATHVEKCAACRILLEALHRDRATWALPPESVLERSLETRREQPLPIPKQPVRLEPALADVRAAQGALASEEATIVAGTCNAGQVSVLMRPPMADAAWRFEIRVWASAPDQSRDVKIALVHDDHLIARATTSSAGSLSSSRRYFPLAGFWKSTSPAARVVVIEDPSTGRLKRRRESSRPGGESRARRRAT